MNRSALDINALRPIAAQFRIPGALKTGAPYGTGHINDTYLAAFDDGGPGDRYILQRINHEIFRDVPRLMDNICRVTAHLGAQIEAGGGDPERETLTVIPTRDDAPYVLTDGGDYWRAYRFIERARTYEIMEDPAQACEGGRAFGRFQQLLADLPPPPLHETIPDFHHTPKRLEALERAVAEDVCNRCSACRAEIDFTFARRPLAESVVTALADGTVPQRVTHNDTKLNNVMFDEASGKAVCVIDLDTVMPGSVLYDFGDMVRTFTPTAAEDEPDLDKLDMDLNVFRELARGYIEAAGPFLQPAETDRLVLAGKLLTFTIGIRFLTDYLAGDVYFKTTRPGHNLDRLRTQLKLVGLIEEREERMESIVREFAG